MNPSAFPLDAVISNDELSRRPAHALDAVAERVALQALQHELAGSPRRVLQRLAEVALELCQAHSAGVSLLEQDGERRFFRWHAVAGKWAPLLWTTLPREFSPCGTVLDRKGPQLMVYPARYYTPMEQIQPQVAEVLLIPFSVGGELVGTVWVVAHDETRRFDREDRRIVDSLARFAAMAYERLSSLSGDDVLQLAHLHKSRARLDTLPAKTVQKRVLVVDDNADTADALAVLLSSLGHEVRTAHGGSAALDIARTMRPDIVLLDLVMPGVSGYDVARELRQTLGSQVRIVAVSGFGDEDDRRRAIEAGFDQHMVKPIDPEALRSLAR